jgi:2-polyprenyl-3-methyl-5-hydroxy-6-metoxy-1,4-benzoquinol methylase
MTLSSLKPNPRANISCYRRGVCRMCNSARLENVLPLTPTPLADAYVTADQRDIPQDIFPLSLYLCHDCGLAQVLDVVQADAIYLDYIYETNSSVGLSEHFSRYAVSAAQKLHLPSGSLVVDIGSNDGILLAGFKSHGMRVVGVDPARDIAAAAAKRGIPTIADFFSHAIAAQIKSSEGAAHLITANNIIANIDALSEIVDAIAWLMDDEGVFIFESFYLKDLIENMVFDFIYHEHLSAFAVTPVAAFLASKGLELFDIDRVPTKGGSLRYYIKKAASVRPVSGIVASYIQEEARFGLAKPETFRAFSKRIDEVKSQVVAQIEKARAQGKTIAGYGASATTASFLYHFGLTQVVDFIADDYPVKHHLFSPGCHIPVLPSSALYERRPGVTLIIAWRYAEIIMKRHRKYLEGGGQFLVPLPEVAIYK